MPGFLLHVGATVTCMHAGQAQPLVPNPRVLVGGQPIVTQTSPYVVAGCAQVAAMLPPCVMAQWITGATRVFAGGIPVLLQDSQAICTPTGTGLLILVTQVQVRGT
ncbi:MAG: hypothetical protein E6I80_06175 [Chloroflexi bacterium]|nr:MAG: hypothetical protein E6I80_06175 [Chloroflexota bacterium]